MAMSPASSRSPGGALELEPVQGALPGGTETGPFSWGLQSHRLFINCPFYPLALLILPITQTGRQKGIAPCQMGSERLRDEGWAGVRGAGTREVLPLWTWTAPPSLGALRIAPRIQPAGRHRRRDSYRYFAPLSLLRSTNGPHSRQPGSDSRWL